jgi:hypothetical protein
MFRRGGYRFAARVFFFAITPLDHPRALAQLDQVLTAPVPGDEAV